MLAKVKNTMKPAVVFVVLASLLLAGVVESNVHNSFAAAKKINKKHRTSSFNGASNIVDRIPNETKPADTNPLNPLNGKKAPGFLGSPRNTKPFSPQAGKPLGGNIGNAPGKPANGPIPFSQLGSGPKQSSAASEINTGLDTMNAPNAQGKPETEKRGDEYAPPPYEDPTPARDTSTVAVTTQESSQYNEPLQAMPEYSSTSTPTPSSTVITETSSARSDSGYGGEPARDLETTSSTAQAQSEFTPPPEPKCQAQSCDLEPKTVSEINSSVGASCINMNGVVTVSTVVTVYVSTTIKTEVPVQPTCSVQGANSDAQAPPARQDDYGEKVTSTQSSPPQSVETSTGKSDTDPGLQYSKGDAAEAKAEGGAPLAAEAALDLKAAGASDIGGRGENDLTKAGKKDDDSDKTTLHSLGSYDSNSSDKTGLTHLTVGGAGLFTFIVAIVMLGA